MAAPATRNECMPSSATIGSDRLPFLFDVVGVSAPGSMCCAILLPSKPSSQTEANACPGPLTSFANIQSSSFNNIAVTHHEGSHSCGSCHAEQGLRARESREPNPAHQRFGDCTFYMKVSKSVRRTSLMSNAQTPRTRVLQYCHQCHGKHRSCSSFCLCVCKSQLWTMRSLR